MINSLSDPEFEAATGLYWTEINDEGSEGNFGWSASGNDFVGWATTFSQPDNGRICKTETFNTTGDMTVNVVKNCDDDSRIFCKKEFEPDANASPVENNQFVMCAADGNYL